MFGLAKFDDFEIFKEDINKKTRYFYQYGEVDKEKMTQLLTHYYYSNKSHLNFALFLMNELVEGNSCVFPNAECSVKKFHLYKVVIPDTIKEIGDYTFENCTQLEKVFLPRKLEKIGRRAFARCRSLKTMGDMESDCSLKLPSTLKYIGKEAFAWCDFTSVNIGRGIKFIDKRAFMYNRHLISFSVSRTLQKLGSEVFCYCTNLKNVKIGGIAILESGTFKHCYSLEEISISKSVKVIEGASFNNCIKLERIKNAEPCEVGYAYHNCDKLKKKPKTHFEENYPKYVLVAH